MKYAKVLLFASLLTLPFGAHSEESAMDRIKQGVSDAANTVSDAVESATEQESPAETRAKIDKMAAATLKRLLSGNQGAKKLHGVSYGYAVFDTRKFSFLITTGFGAGVAVEQGSAKRTYMKMATGGANIGLGGEFFQLVILFENKTKFRKFVDDGFEGGVAASAVGGKDSVDVNARFTDGIAVYKLTEKGLKLAADITGTKYWKDDDLN